MKYSLLPGFCFLFTVVSCSAVSGTTGQRPEGICTRDINEWGNASRCTCEQGEYDARSGLCLAGQGGKTMRVQGKVTAGVMDVGGETTGFVVEVRSGESYELILKIADQKKLSDLDGLWFEIEGDLINLQSPERGERRAIISEKITFLE